MKIGIIAFSQKGISLGEKIALKFGGEAVLSGRDADRKKWTEEGFREKDALIFVGATGIAVRTIAPHINHKTVDQAVIVIDELGTFVIPVLSGHIGGANELANDVAGYIGATPVITTATDINGVFAVDTWARKQGMRVLNPERIKDISAKLLSGNEITVGCEDEIEGELPKLVKLIKTADIGEIYKNKSVKYYCFGKKADDREFRNEAGLCVKHGKSNETMPAEKGSSSADPGSSEKNSDLLSEIDVLVSYSRCDESIKSGALILVPRILTLGIGCRRGASLETVEKVFADFLDTSGIYREAVSAVASIDLKKDEAAVIEFASRLKLELKTFSAGELSGADGAFTASEFVKSTVGVDNVCERSAVYAAGNGAELIAAKYARDGVTFALAKKPFKPHW